MIASAGIDSWASSRIKKLGWKNLIQLKLRLVVVENNFRPNEKIEKVYNIQIICNILVYSPVDMNVRMTYWTSSEGKKKQNWMTTCIRCWKKFSEFSLLLHVQILTSGSLVFVYQFFLFSPCFKCISVNYMIVSSIIMVYAFYKHYFLFIYLFLKTHEIRSFP